MGSRFFWSPTYIIRPALTKLPLILDVFADFFNFSNENFRCSGIGTRSLECPLLHCNKCLNLLTADR